MDFVLDIKEKEVGNAILPALSESSASSTGFPQPKKRTTRVSAFRKRHQSANDVCPRLGQTGTRTKSPPSPGEKKRPTPPDRLDAVGERRRIDQENKALLASMSTEQIEQEQQELLCHLDPKTIQMLLKRAKIDQADFPLPFDEAAEAAVKAEDTSTPAAVVNKPNAVSDITKTKTKTKTGISFDEDAGLLEPPSRLFQATTKPGSDRFAANTTHFPSPKPLPDLDPADPDFLKTLHSKYFPNLPADPSKLAWMAPIPSPDSVADRNSPYYPGQSSLSICALRFDFKGRLLPPSKSRQIPVTKGLHHHGQAPEAAGYTISELGILARSSVPAQRCIAFQTLGRVLYRLGQGEWGAGESELAQGIWTTIQNNRVIDSLLDAANVPEGQGHRGSRAFSVEALWLLEKGSWKEKATGMARRSFR